jgi:hypothetical protein
VGHAGCYGVIAIAMGKPATLIGRMAVLVAVRMGVTVLESSLTT